MNQISQFPLLECASTGFDAVICLNSTLPAISQFKQLKQIPILAADGAANRLLGMKITPDYVIGDMDSVSIERFPKPISSKLIVDTNQETNDFGKVLDFAVKQGYRRIIILGFHGGDLEHTFNNWSVLSGESRFESCCILDRNRYGIPITSSFRLRTIENEIISIIPQPRAIVTTSGLCWPLSAELLELGIREGARNRAIGDSISIDIHSGSIILFIDSRLPYAPMLSQG